MIACRSRKTGSLGLGAEKKISTDDLRPVLYEWRFDMKTGKVVEGVLDSTHRVEFPRVYDRLIGRKTTVAYAAKFEENCTLPNVITSLFFN